MNIKNYIIQFTVDNPKLSILLGGVLFVIITTELWRGVKWLFTKLFFSKHQTQQNTPSLNSHFDSVGDNTPQDLGVVNLLPKKSTTTSEKGFDTSLPSLPVENNKWKLNNENYLELENERQ